jgi:hypothetical protein
MAWSIYGSYEVGVMSEIHADAKHTPIAANAAAADKFVFTARRPMTVVGFGLEVTTSYADMGTADQTVSLDKRVTHDSDVGREELAAIPMKTGYANGHQYIKEFNSVDLDVGQQLVIEQKVQGAGGGGLAGACIPFIFWYPRSEIQDLQTNLHMV